MFLFSPGSNTDPPPLCYRDVLVLCFDPRDDLIEDGHLISPAIGLVRGLRECDIPVRVVKSNAASDNEGDIRDTALAVSDEVTVTDWDDVRGLERKVVVVVMERTLRGVSDRLYGASRCSAQLVWVDW